MLYAVMPYGVMPKMKTKYPVNQPTEVMASRDSRDKLVRIFCDVCEVGKQEATTRCYECENFLCADCETAHLSFKVLRNHRVDLREIQRPSDEAAVNTVPSVTRHRTVYLHHRTNGCKKHPGEVHRFFCETCQRMICQDCTIADHPRPDHKYVDLEDALCQKREKLMALMQCSKQIEAKLDTALNETTELRRSIDTAELIAQTEVNRTADHALVVSQKLVEQERQRHLQDVICLGTRQKTIVSDRRDALQNTLANLRQTQSLATRVVESGSDHEILKKYRTLTDSLQQLGAFDSGSLETRNNLDNFEFSSQGYDLNRFNCLRFDTSSLGHIRGEWILHREMGGSVPTGGLRNTSALAVARCGDMIVVENQRRSAQVYGQGGAHRLSLATTENILKETRADIDKILGFIRAVAFSRAGHIIVCDCSNFVKVFTQHGRYMCAFTTTSPSDNIRGPVRLCCLAVDERNRIYVGDRSRRCVTIHEPNGARIRLVECTRPAQLAASVEFLIVLPADPTDPIKLLDHLGSTRRALSVPESLKPWLPVSVACSSENKKIFVVNGHKDGDKAVHEFTMEGDYRGSVARNLVQPAGIALSRSQDKEELFVSDNNSVKVFRKI